MYKCLFYLCSARHVCASLPPGHCSLPHCVSLPHHLSSAHMTALIRYVPSTRHLSSTQLLNTSFIHFVVYFHLFTSPHHNFSALHSYISTLSLKLGVYVYTTKLDYKIVEYLDIHGFSEMSAT